MLKQYKKTLIVTSLLTLLPIGIGLLLWNRFPAQMAVHYGLNGQPDGLASVPFAVFVPPLLMLAVQWLCLLFTLLDPGNKGRNRKPLKLVLWILPILSNVTCGMMYALALGAEFPVDQLLTGAIGLLFAFIGNYLPKCKMNSTIGIKVPWTYTSEENWNATHRFGGRVWVIGGLVMALCAFLPSALGGALWLGILLALVIIPTVYSWRYYKAQKARGDAVLSPMQAKGKLTKGSIAALILVLIFAAAVLFLGDLEYHYYEDYFTVKASCYNDLTVFYDAIEDVEYREGNVEGHHVGGYGSFRLLMGYFHNEEFGTHTRYTYYKPEACVVVTLKNSTLVLSAETTAETQQLYQELSARMK